jgi:hypothetical protein
MPYLHALLKLAHIFCVGLYCGNDWKILFAVDFFMIKFLLDAAIRFRSNFFNNFTGPPIIKSLVGGVTSTPLHALGAS